LGFWKWLYKKAKEGKEDFLIMSSLIGGLVLAAVSLIFGIKHPLVFFGIPIGILMFLYGIYRVP
jgi:hypothetical protein